MSAIPGRRRRRAVVAAVLGLVGVVALPAGLLAGGNTLLNEKGGDSVDNAPTTRIPVTPTALVAVTNSRSEVAALAIVALDPSGKGGSIVSVPVGANAEIPKSGTIHRIADTFATGGIDGLKADVEGLLNVSFDTAVNVDAAGLALLVGAVGERDVNLPAPVLDSSADGSAVQVAPAGEQKMTASLIASALASSQAGVAESSRLANVKALWTAVASAATTEPVPTTLAQSTSAPAAAPSDVAGYFAGLLAGRVQVWQLSATLLTDAARNPGNVDLYELNGAEVIMVMASVAPSAIAIVSNNLTVMIDSPFDDAALVQEAVLRLAYVGANVVVVRTISDAPATQTQVFYNDDLVRAEVETYSALFGTMTYTQSSEIIEGVNARIVLGEDFRSFISSEAGRTIATTTTTVAG